VRAVVTLTDYPEAETEIVLDTYYKFEDYVYTLPEVTLITSTDVPDASLFVDMGYEASSLATYNQTETYSLGSVVQYNGYTYKVVNDFYTVVDDTPSSYWTNTGSVILVLAYGVGSEYDTSSAVYVSYNDTCYQLINALYVADSTIINSDLWTNVRSVSPVLTYSAGTEYSSGVFAVYNSEVYQLLNTNTLIASTASPDTRFWDMLGINISSAVDYEAGLAFTDNDFCIYDNSFYVLTNSSYLSTSTIIDSTYWDVIGLEIPSTEYVSGTEYTLGSYVTYNSVLYEMTDVIYAPTDTTPNTDYWMYVNDVIPTIYTYTPGTVYALNDYCSYNSVLYQLNRISFISGTLEPDMRFWSLYEDTPFGDDTYRTFAIAINASTTNAYDFTSTDSNNETYYIGTRFGELLNHKITLGSSNYTTYQQTDGLMPYGTYLSADGYVCGTVKARSQATTGYGDFDFEVTARTNVGVSKTTDVTLSVPLKNTGLTTTDTTLGYYSSDDDICYIDKGYRLSTVSANLVVPKIFERDWFNMISSRAFDEVSYYKPSDTNFGLQRLPIIPIKRNILGCLNNDYQQMLTPLMMNNIFKLQGSSYDIRVKTGNLRYIVARDDEYNDLYEFVYMELLPASRPFISDSAYTNYPRYDIKEITNLRSELISLFGSDDVFGNSDNDLYSFTSVYDSVTNTYDDCYLYRANPKKSLMSNLTYTTPNGTFTRDPTQFLPIIPVAFLNMGESDKLFSKLSEYELDSTICSDVILNPTSMKLKPQGALYSKETVIELVKRDTFPAITLDSQYSPDSWYCEPIIISL